MSTDAMLSQQVQDCPEGVSFLTSLLVRHREIGSASLSAERGQLRVSFYLRRLLEEREWLAIVEVVQLSWRAFFRLQRVRPHQTEIVRGEPPRDLPIHGESQEDLEMESVSILRDLSTLSGEEVSMLVALIKEHFRSDLACNEESVQDDEEQQDELIYRSLERLRGVHFSGSLTGFRDDMRVLIYSSAERR